MNFKGKIAILISSYDGSEDLWHALEQSYKDHWPDNSLNIYLATNHKKPKFEIFNVLSIGKEISWSDNILKCLELIDEEYIFLLYDDIFLYKNIDTDVINEYFEDIVSNKWDYLRLHFSPKPNRDINDRVGIIYQNQNYRLSTAMAIIRKEVFKDLLVKTESAWEFEINGSLRSNKYPNFYGSLRNDFPYLNAVVKGKWFPPVYNYLKKRNYPVSEKNIKKMSFMEHMNEEFKRLKFQIFIKIVPHSLQGITRKLFKKE